MDIQISKQGQASASADAFHLDLDFVRMLSDVGGERAWML